MRDKKAQIWISAVLYILIAAVAMFLILQMGIPLLNQMRDRSSYTRAKDVMTGIDKSVTEVATEGEGSQRIIPVEVRQGEIVMDNKTQALKWTLDTESKVIEPRTSVQYGNVKVYSNIDVSTRSPVACGTGGVNQCYEAENSRIKVDFLIAGNKTDPAEINTIDLIQSITFKDTGDTIPGGFVFSVNGKGSQGTGYTEIKPADNTTNTDKATYILHMTNAPDMSNPYDLTLTLESEADFIKSNVNIIEANP